MVRYIRIGPVAIVKCLLLHWFLLWGITVVAQQTSAEDYRLQVSYTFMLHLNSPLSYQANLYLGSEKSLFVYGLRTADEVGEEISPDSQGQRYMFNLRDTTTYYIWSDRTKNRILQLEQIPGSGEQCIVAEQIPVIVWSFSGRQKMIQDFPCFEATGHFAGRDYTLWYTDQIPAYFGPWKFHGLPGLVLEAEDRSGEVRLYASMVRSLQSGIQPENPMINGTFQVMDRPDYLKQLKHHFSTLEKKMMTKVGRGFQVRVKSSPIKTIEIYDQ